ncbi:MAG TPA: DUF6624 domain-containing protein [Thermoanaerobaculia bacterium]|nr:DUF6624 domain-containing protein [Thermoanaerobaculia bacterium]
MFKPARFAVAAAILIAACTHTAPPPPPDLTSDAADPALSAELVAMLKEDQEVRQRWIKDQKNEALREEMRALSKKHVERFGEIVAAHGWPGKSKAGMNGASAAWTIAQHGGPEFLGKMLPLMYDAVIKRELDESLYGTSLDRVLMQRGKKQMYGTQFDVDPATGKCEPMPIEDAEHVEERRAKAGMTSLAEYTKELCAMYLQKK